MSVDIGGTFTDVVSIDREDGTLLVGKSATTVTSPAEGIISALDEIGVDIASADRFFHGSTLAANTLLERRGARVGLLTTAGFRDLLEIGRASWPPYRLTWARPEPLVPRRLCREIPGRILKDGSVLEEIDSEAVLREANALVAQGVEAIAVCFINSYAQPEHERCAAATMRDAGISVPIVLSHEISRRYGEHERAVTAIGEAYLRPKMRRYFERLQGGCEANGFSGQLFITSSDAGVMGVEEARERTLRTLVSGCASGIAGAAAVGRAHGWENIIAIDMGGTSFDAGMIRDGSPTMRVSSVVSDLEFLTPMVELATIGAGGGSIAWVDNVGGLNVGPRSAGADPGPACYNGGGVDATFTDGAVATGLLSEKLLGGGLRLHKGLAVAAIKKTIATPLAIDPLEAASGIVSVIEAKMARTIEDITIGKGFDPRDFVLFAYGGGGPLVAARLAEELSIPMVVIPPHAGVFSAWGMQTLDVVHDFSVTLVTDLAPNDGEPIALPEFENLLAQARDALEREGIEPRNRLALMSLEMRYEGQEHTLSVDLGTGSGTMIPRLLRERFAEQHQMAYGFVIDDAIQIVGCRVRAIGRLPKPSLDAPAKRPASAAGSPVAVEHRSVTHWASGASSESWPVYRRDSVGSEVRVDGPSIFEELTTTTLVPPNWSTTCDRFGNLILTSIREAEVRNDGTPRSAR